MHKFYIGEKAYSVVHKQNVIIEDITKGFSTNVGAEVTQYTCRCIQNSEKVTLYRDGIMSMFEHDTIFGLTSIK